MIRKFKNVEGTYIEKIEGQERFAYSQSDSIEFYELMEIAEKSEHPGSVIKFYDFITGDVYCPFQKKKNTVFGKPAYSNGLCYFLKADCDEQVIVLYCYYPDKILEVVKEFDIKSVNMYNLGIIGNSIHVVSQDDTFECYYPEKFSFPSGEHESVIFIDDGIVYCQKWIEDGWDDMRNCQTSEYKCYDKIIQRDFNGTVISEETGSLVQNTDGTWWIS